MTGNGLPYTHFYRAAAGEGRLLHFLTGQSLIPAKQLAYCSWRDAGGRTPAWPWRAYGEVILWDHKNSNSWGTPHPRP